MITTNCEDIEELRMFEFVDGTSRDSLEDIPGVNFKHQGLKKESWVLEKGRRTIRHYNNNDDECVVHDIYEYVMNGLKVVSYTRKVEWLKLDGTVGISKVVDEQLAMGKISELNIKIRTNQINALRDKGEGLRLLAATLPEPSKSQYIQVADSVDAMFLHYDSEITHYETVGNSEFLDAVNNEADPNIVAILNIVVNAEGETVKQGIIEEIT